MEFETQRLLIREFKELDVATIHEYARQEHVVKYETWGPNNLKETMDFLHLAMESSRLVPRYRYDLCICLKETGRHIGACGIYVKDKEFKLATLGYVLNPDYWNNGYMTEAVRVLIDVTKQDLKIQNIQATCDCQNIPSKRVLEKVGFTMIETIKGHFEQKGVMRDSFLFEFVGEEGT